MTVHFEGAASNELLPGDSQTIHIRRDDVILPSGETGVTEFASHGTGLGVVVIPTTVGGHRLLTRRFRHPIDSLVWEFPRSIVAKISVSEAEHCLLEATGLQATCRMIGSIAPDSGALSTRYGVYEAYVDADAMDGSLPVVESQAHSESEWFSEDRFAIHVRDSEVNDAITLAAIAIQQIEALTSDF